MRRTFNLNKPAIYRIVTLLIRKAWANCLTERFKLHRLPIGYRIPSLALKQFSRLKESSFL
jgi:hypothetical protein